MIWNTKLESSHALPIRRPAMALRLPSPSSRESRLRSLWGIRLTG